MAARAPMCCQSSKSMCAIGLLAAPSAFGAYSRDAQRREGIESGMSAKGETRTLAFDFDTLQDRHTADFIIRVKPSITSRLLRQPTHHDTLPIVHRHPGIYGAQSARRKGKYEARMSAADNSHQPRVRPLHYAAIEPRGGDPFNQHIGPEQCLIAISSVDTEAHVLEVWMGTNHATTITARGMSAMGRTRLPSSKPPDLDLSPPRRGSRSE